ncbi:ABC transporter ATP-binding protein [Bifidobacterium sp. ESL0732]|uniref:ABC transporter ATP-binding protein n=1 Tax=Bifidobacterium sp. ESL0732 TaxID=2983222 RepID=UPI0023F983BA|nr:ABC transporter ATP-binding protein [Bifidobacterium sp. ESL0732]WEV64770.1 ABC transporter ATP-binding protein [Bifidobacterium sp. ESL0732]
MQIGDSTRNDKPAAKGRSRIPSLTTLRRSLRLLMAVAPISVIVLLILTVVRALLSPLQILATTQIVNSVATGVLAKVVDSAVLFAVVLVGMFVAENVIKYLSDSIREKLSYRANCSIIDKLTTLETQQFEDAQTNDCIQRAGGDTGGHIFTIFDSARDFLQSLLTIVSVFSLLVSWNKWVAFFLLLAPIPGTIGTLMASSKQYNIDYRRAGEKRLSDYYRSILTSDNAAKEVHLFGLGGLLSGRYKTLIAGFLKQDLGMSRTYLWIALGLGILTTLANIGAVAVGALQAMHTGNVGQLAGYISATGSFGQSVLLILVSVSSMYQSLLYAGNWVHLMDTQPAVIRSGGEKLDDGTPMTVSFRNVRFAYPGSTDGKEILHGVSFDLPAGQCSALVGLNGAGKSTIAKLILRVYEPTSGSILINGRDISEYSRSSLYGRCSAIFQDYIRYERPLRENVGFGDPDRIDDDDAIEHALDLVGMKGLEQSLPEGLDTVLGRHFEGGYQLSIGQWQRVALARALFRRPSLLIMDEPTASVDALSEKHFFDSLDRADSTEEGQRRTTILIAHRFTTITHASHIVVLRDGDIVGEGDHETLLSDCPYYRGLYEAQVVSQQHEDPALMLRPENIEGTSRCNH